MDFSTIIYLTVFGLIGMIIMQWFSLAIKKQSEQKKSEAASIAAVLRSEEAASRAAALEIMARKLSINASDAKEIDSTIEKLSTKISVVKSPTGAASIENLISSYHEQALSQAKIQFWFSVIAATVGFIWILYTGTDIEPDKASSLLKTLPGVAMDAVAFLFFRQAGETRQRATELYDRLRSDKQMTAAALLVTQIGDEKIRGVVQAQIALHMAGVQQSPIDVSSILSRSA